MANHQRYNPTNMVAATWLFPLGTKLLVTEIHNGSIVIVMVTDRPNRRYAQARVDLSPNAFSQLDGLEKGLAEVTVTRIK